VVQRFRSYNGNCKRKIFAERLPGIRAPEPEKPHVWPKFSARLATLGVEIPAPGY
jgi:hypothetical protein